MVFNEIMYHPSDDDGVEWIELHNQMAVDMDLSGWSVQGGIRYVFPQGTIVKGGAYLVLALITVSWFALRQPETLAPNRRIP